MNHSLINLYAPFGPERLKDKPKPIKVKDVTESNIKEILDSSLERWTYEIESDVIFCDRLITTVTLYCCYGAFTGRAITDINNVELSIEKALVNASSRLIDKGAEEPYTISSPISLYAVTYNSDKTVASLSPVINDSTLSPAINDSNSSEAKTDNEPNTSIVIDPQENPPVFSSENLEPQPTEPHDGMTGEERNTISQENVPFDNATPVVQEAINNSVGLSSAPTIWTDEYKNDVKNFMSTVGCHNQEELNNWLDRWKKGCRWDRNFTPADWLEFRKFSNELLDSQTC